MFRTKVLPAAVAAVIVLGGAGAVLADNGERESDERQEINTVLNAKTSLSQAVAIAEKETGGKAVDTGFENQNGVMAYEVKIAKGNTLQKVLVDLDIGKVVKVAAAAEDREERYGREDSDHHEHREHDED